MKVLFSEGSSLTAREFLSVLGPSGHWIEVLDPSLACICRFSRWTRRVHVCPPSNADPLGYLETVNHVFDNGSFDVFLPTHEQAWLLAVAGSKLQRRVAVALSSPESFARVQSKLEFARLLDEIGLPQPRWILVDSLETLARQRPPFYLKAPFGTAGSGVRFLKTAEQAQSAFQSLRQFADGGPLMLQSVATGNYAQVQALFDHGRLVACHSSTQTAVGIGQSAAGRMSVDHPFARQDVSKIGKFLNWHGGITLDYLFRGSDRLYLECNPRTVEPANAAASGVDLPGLQLALSLGNHPTEAPPGTMGVKTHGSLAVVLGTGACVGTRKAVLHKLGELLFHRKVFQDSRERLTPFLNDFPSVIPLLAVAAQALISPRSVLKFSQASIERYTVTRRAIVELSGSLVTESF